MLPMDVKEKKPCAVLMMLMAPSAVLMEHVSVVSRMISDACATQDQGVTDAKYVSSSVNDGCVICRIFCVSMRGIFMHLKRLFGLFCSNSS